MTPTPQYLTLDGVLELLRSRRGNRTLEDLGDEIGVSYQLLGHVLRGARTPGRKILKFLGLKKVEQFYQWDRR